MEFFAISGLINGVGATSFGILIIYKNWRDKINQVFFALMFSVTLWSFSYWRWLSEVNDPVTALFWIRLVAAASLLIPVFYFHWVALLIDKPKNRFQPILYLATLLFIPFSFTDLLVSSVGPKLIFPFWPNPGLLYDLYIAFFYVGLVIYSLFELYEAYQDPQKKGQVFYLILGSVFGFGGGLFNFLLWYNVPVLPYGNFLVALFPICFGYAMLRYKLFNSKVIATELLTFTIWILLLIRTLTLQTIQEKVIDGSILLFSVIAGIFLIRSVRKEVEQREKLEVLTGELEKANAELTRLDKAKSEFVSIVSHQLRTPLTAVKGYISMMREGDYGELKTEQQDTLGKVAQSAEHLITLINDLLNLNRIEDGRIIYEFKAVDIAEMIDGVVFEQKELANKKGLKLTWIKPHGLPMAWADPDKIRQVVMNFIDNAVKYTAEGSVNVSLKLENNYLIFAVKDTGVGMGQEEKVRLFKKFERGEGGRLMYTGGTGLGLYVAKLMTEAHQGEISGVSDGKGLGSTFSIKIPTEEYAKANSINQNQTAPVAKPATPTIPVSVEIKK